MNRWQASYRASNKGRQTRKAYQKRVSASPKGLLLTARGRAHKAGLAFNLTLDFVEGLTAGMKCAITGMALKWESGPLQPSLDRIIPELGYFRENVQCTARWANFARSNLPLEEFKAVLRQFDPTKV